MPEESMQSPIDRLDERIEKLDERIEKLKAIAPHPPVGIVSRPPGPFARWFRGVILRSMLYAVVYAIGIGGCCALMGVTTDGGFFGGLTGLIIGAVIGTGQHVINELTSRLDRERRADQPMNPSPD